MNFFINFYKRLVSLFQKKNHDEYQYLKLIKDIIDNGSLEEGRNGNTLTKFGYTMEFSLKDGVIPIITTKHVAWRICFEELFWFIRGSTNNKELKNKSVNIWNGNSTRRFLDERGLYNLEEDDLGPIYGFQWRHYNAEYNECNSDYSNKGIDQLEKIINDLKNKDTRSSRRHILTAWNPCQIDKMALPPCHMICQFHVREGKYLSCALFQRSGDVGLGVPFNIASYSLLTHILAKHCELEADKFVHFIGNCHIYEEHVDILKKQILRSPIEFPKIIIKSKHKNIEDYNLLDIHWVYPYNSLGKISMAMKV